MYVVRYITVLFVAGLRAVIAYPPTPSITGDKLGGPIFTTQLAPYTNPTIRTPTTIKTIYVSPGTAMQDKPIQRNLGVFTLSTSPSTTQRNLPGLQEGNGHGHNANYLIPTILINEPVHRTVAGNESRFNSGQLQNSSRSINLFHSAGKNNTENMKYNTSTRGIHIPHNTETKNSSSSGTNQGSNHKNYVGSIPCEVFMYGVRNGSTANLNSTPSGGHNNHTNMVTTLCGFPPYNDRERCTKQDYYADPILQCERTGGVIVFSICMGFFGTVIIVLNILIPVAMWRDKGMRTQYDCIKASLAIADIVPGFLILFSVLPNVFHVRQLTVEEAVKFAISDTNSLGTILVGALLIITTEASILHLLFLSIERFIAIKWPFWYKRRRNTTVILTLVALWLFSIAGSLTPAAFPKHFEFKFQPALLISMLTEKMVVSNGQEFVGFGGRIFTCTVFLLPYLILVAFCIATGITSCHQLSNGVRKFSNRERSVTNNNSWSRNSKNRNITKLRRKPETSVTVTIVIMILAFSASALPFTIVMFLFVNSEKLDCNNYAVIYATSFYFGLLNSLSNPVIYTIRDKKFRQTLWNIFRGKKHRNLKRVASALQPNSKTSSTRL